MLQYDVKVPILRITCPGINRFLGVWQIVTSKILDRFLKIQTPDYKQVGLKITGVGKTRLGTDVAG